MPIAILPLVNAHHLLLATNEMASGSSQGSQEHNIIVFIAFVMRVSIAIVILPYPTHRWVTCTVISKNTASESLILVQTPYYPENQELLVVRS